MEISYSAIFAFIFVIQFNDTFGQSGNVVREEACATQTKYVACPNPASVMRLESLTIYSTDQLGDILAWDPATSCYNIPKCQRNIAAGTTDTGLGEAYRYLYETVKGECEGRSSCFITGPNATTVYGEATENYQQNSRVRCPATPKQKIFVSMLLAAKCVSVQNNASTITPVPTTTQTVTTTTATTLIKSETTVNTSLVESDNEDLGSPPVVLGASGNTSGSINHGTVYVTVVSIAITLLSMR